MLSFSTSLPSYRRSMFQTDSLPLCQSAYLSTTVCLLNSNDRCLSIIVILLLLFNITYRFKCHLFGLFCVYDPIIQWPPSFSCPSSLVTFFYRALIFDTVVHLPYALSSRRVTAPPQLCSGLSIGWKVRNTCYSCREQFLVSASISGAS